jgi:hypothetical protein
VLLVGPVLLIGRESRTPKTAAAFLGPGLVWLAFAWGYYGDLLPNTFHAKRASSTLPEFVQKIVRWMTDPLGSLTSPITGDLPWWRPALSLGLVILSVLPLLDPRVRRRPAILYALVVYPWVLVLAYGLIGAPTDHRWEYFAAAFFFRLAALVGLFSLVSRLVERWSANPESRRSTGRVATAAVALALLALVVVDARDCFGRLDRQQSEPWYGGRYHDYLAISRWIDADLPAGATLLLLEPGVVGYHTRMRILDMPGLVTKGFRAQSIYDYNAYAAHYRPDFLLGYGDVSAIAVTPDLRYRRLMFFPKRGFLLDFSLLARQ